jgi:DNA-binding beta-propeller fold protein YncE
LLLALAAGATGPSGYHLAKTYKLGGEGGWDYLTFDAATGRLFIARATRVMVVDAGTGKLLGEIPDTPGVHGIALAPELGRGFTSNGRGNAVTIFDLASLKLLGTVETGKNPDAIAYDPATQRVFTFNGGSDDSTAIDAAKGTVAGTLALGGRPEFAVADGQGPIFANLEDKSEIVAIDSRKLSVTARWPLAPCEEPSGLAIDREHRRLFSGCANKLMAIVDAASGRVLATLPIGRGVDAAAFDPGTALAFSSNGEGTLTVIHEDSPEKFSVVENVPTQRGARTMALDPKTHRIFLVTAEYGPAPAATAENPRPRPTIVPGSFVVLVVER